MSKIQSVRLRIIDFNFIFDKLDELLDIETVIQVFTRNSALSLALPVPAAVAGTKSIGESGRESGKPNPLKNVYFGEEHVQTRNYLDAFTAGVTMTWREGKSK